jgi:DNA-binding NtrC family response regulator
MAEKSDLEKEVNKRILVVDDDKRVLFILCTALERMENRFEILSADNGKVALQTVKREAVDLVVTDVRMPEMNGIELTAAIKSFAPETDVVWITAFDCRSLRFERKKYGVLRCINKPVRIEEIRKVVLEVLEANHGDKKSCQEEV